jgi:UDP-glucose 4-epimerase
VADGYDLADKKMLVTGGAGFIGSQIVPLLVGAGCREVVVLDNMVRGRRANLSAVAGSNAVRVIEDDIRNRNLVKSLVEGTDTVFHQAALRITHCAAEPRQAQEVMVDATFDLFDDCLRSGVRKVVFASSASVYGMAQEFPTSEQQHPYDNRTLYGTAKTFGEGVLRSFHDMHGLDYVALRYFNVYGPGMDLHGRYTEVLVRWMEKIERGEPPIIFGDGLQTMDFIDVRDVARANLFAAECAATDMVFNVGMGAETSLIELAHRLAKAMGRADLTPVHVGDNPVNPVRRRLAGTRAAREHLGFEAMIPLDEGLLNLVSWWRSENANALAEVPSP